MLKARDLLADFMPYDTADCGTSDGADGTASGQDGAANGTSTGPQGRVPVAPGHSAAPGHGQEHDGNDCAGCKFFLRF